MYTQVKVPLIDVPEGWRKAQKPTVDSLSDSFLSEPVDRQKSATYVNRRVRNYHVGGKHVYAS